MSSMSWKQFVGTVFTLLAFVLVVRLVQVAIFDSRSLFQPEYVLKGIVMAHPPGGAPLPPEPEQDWARALASADLDAGSKLLKRCRGCHDITPALMNKIGPGLYGIVGARRAGRAGFDYSSAMNQKGGTWSYDALFEFLRDPQLAIPNTKMSFEGLRSAQDRINLIAALDVMDKEGPPVSARGAAP